MEPTRPKTLLAIGEIVVEIMATELGQSFLAPGSLIGPFPSGAPAIFVDQAARLGQPCAIIAAVGDDDFGTLNIERLRASGVDVSAIRRVAGVPTGTAFVRYGADGERAFVFNIALSASGHLRLDEAADALLAQGHHLHVMGSSLFSPDVVAVVREAVKRVRSRGGTISFDPNIRREMLGRPGMREALAELLRACDLFLPSGPELFLFTAAQDERGAIAELLDLGVRAVVLKRGAAGASYHDRDGAVYGAAFAVDEIDPTGAGDCFGAGFVCAWLAGLTPDEALAQANACGALAVGAKGPMAGSGTADDIRKFLATRKAVSS